MNEQLNFNLFLEKLDFQKQSIKTLHKKLFDKVDWKSITESQWETLFDKVKTQKEKELEIHENDIKQFDKFLITITNKIEKENLLLQKKIH